MSGATGTEGSDFSHELSRESLLRLARREIGAIHVPGFCPQGVAEQAARKALQHDALGNYHKKHTSTVGRVHMPHIDTAWNAEKISRYHDAALPSIHDVRSMFAPHLSPIDHVRLLLQEYWPGGANLLRLRGRPCYIGALRVFQPTTSTFYPHNDHISQETDAPESHGVVEQLVANVYLRVPDEGGDLQLWRRDPTPAETRTILEVEGLDPDSVEPPVHVIHPQAGDLIIFSSQMLHAVTPARDGHRVGMAAFIACKGPDEPLLYWS
ncbi:2OG-Fe(II) oxygenase [Streptomyces oryzae]|uniref:2OG-Fe(II) oxygenase n=1 Tax=Streptomyces oryzae TaxID=1434886 RepID=A0ABS3XIU1_9ACTN|nr:2OG-Fe(II) oxygenase [Streptomyces oryzae]MBO8195311.1 2OG-Fe(II) oxygenase [Streptomyces oryzae]